MFIIITTAFIILQITAAKDILNSTNFRNSDKYGSNDLNELMDRMDRMESNNKDMSLNIETIVQQQLLLMQEISKLSQNPPSCQGPGGGGGGGSGDGGGTGTEYPILPYKKSFCSEAMGPSSPNGVYKIIIPNTGIEPFDVYCMKSFDTRETEGTWLIIARREDNATDFYQDWKQYQRGFGDLNRSFWIGLDKLYALTRSSDHELWVSLKLNNGTHFWAKYSTFAIGNEADSYAVKNIGTFTSSTNEGDALKNLVGIKFSTNDNDNDFWVEINCAETYRGAWWFDKKCSSSNLNGVYTYDSAFKFTQRIRWWPYPALDQWITYAHMAIRPKQ